MSGLASRRTREERGEFADAFLQKPFSVELLLGAVEQLLRPVPKAG